MSTVGTLYLDWHISSIEETITVLETQLSQAKSQLDRARELRRELLREERQPVPGVYRPQQVGMCLVCERPIDGETCQMPVCAHRAPKPSLQHGYPPHEMMWDEANKRWVQP